MPGLTSPDVVDDRASQLLKDIDAAQQAEEQRGAPKKPRFSWRPFSRRSHSVEVGTNGVTAAADGSQVVTPANENQPIPERISVRLGTREEWEELVDWERADFDHEVQYLGSHMELVRQEDPQAQKLDLQRYYQGGPNPLDDELQQRLVMQSVEEEKERIALGILRGRIGPRDQVVAGLRELLSDEDFVAIEGMVAERLRTSVVNGQVITPVVEVNGENVKFDQDRAFIEDWQREFLKNAEQIDQAERRRLLTRILNRDNVVRGLKILKNNAPEFVAGIVASNVTKAVVGGALLTAGAEGWVLIAGTGAVGGAASGAAREYVKQIRENWSQDVKRKRENALAQGEDQTEADKIRLTLKERAKGLKGNDLGKVGRAAVKGAVFGAAGGLVAHAVSEFFFSHPATYATTEQPQVQAGGEATPVATPTAPEPTATPTAITAPTESGIAPVDQGMVHPEPTPMTVDHGITVVAPESAAPAEIVTPPATDQLPLSPPEPSYDASLNPSLAQANVAPPSVTPSSPDLGFVDTANQPPDILHTPPPVAVPPAETLTAAGPEPVVTGGEGITLSSDQISDKLAQLTANIEVPAGSNPWALAEEALKQADPNHIPSNQEIYELTKAYCQDNGIAVKEWGLQGQTLDRFISVGKPLVAGDHTKQAIANLAQKLAAGG